LEEGKCNLVRLTVITKNGGIGHVGSAVQNRSPEIVLRLGEGVNPLAGVWWFGAVKRGAQGGIQLLGKGL